MTIKEVIEGFREGVGENTERNAYANELFQEAVRIGMELNMQYHTPEEIREIMGRLIGKKVDDSFRMFPPFYTDFGKKYYNRKRCLYQFWMPFSRSRRNTNRRWSAHWTQCGTGDNQSQS